MTNLSELQKSVLRRVNATGAEGFIFPSRGGAERRMGTTIASLLKRGLLIVTDKSGNDCRLFVTEEGRAVLAPESVPALGHPSADAATFSTAESPTKARGKLGLIVSMMEGPSGATIADLCEATGWQAHSVRGAISGTIKKKLGRHVASDVVESDRVYRIIARVTA